MDNYNIRALRCENLSFVYDDDAEQEKVILPPPALDNVTVSINRGEYIAVLGHNGSGKSTFAKLLNLILQPTVSTVSPSISHEVMGLDVMILVF